MVENMRSFLRTLPPGLARDVVALAAAAFVIGVSFGAIAVASGVSGPKAIAMSVFVFAGGSQFLAVGVVGAGGTALAAVLGGLVLNARHLPFGLAIGDVLGRHKLLGSHLIIDESTAFTLARTDPVPGPAPAEAGANGTARRQAFWLAAGSLFVVWNVGTVIGVVAGNTVGDPDTFGIDAAFPAGMLALLLPALKDRPALRVALGGAVLALAAAPFLPPGLPVLVALLGLVFALPVPRKRPGAGRSIYVEPPPRDIHRAFKESDHL
jgi:predicted branched-subunit amino acid permease